MVRVSFHFLSFSISFPKLNHFYYFTSLHGLQRVENLCAHLRDIELKTGGKIPCMLSPCITLYIIELESMKLKNRENTGRKHGPKSGGNRLVRRSGSTSRGNVVLVFRLRIRTFPLAVVLTIFVGMK